MEVSSPRLGLKRRGSDLAEPNGGKQPRGADNVKREKVGDDTLSERACLIFFVVVGLLAGARGTPGLRSSFCML